MNTLQDWFFVVPIVALAIPATLALAAMTSPRRAGFASGAALALALLFLIGAVLTGDAGASTGLGVRVDAPTCVMLLLVGFLGAIIVRYSLTYLQGDVGRVSYLRWLLLTLSAVTALVIANNLFIVALAWTATSLALHQLLTHYGDRPPALVAAHKKFLVSRLADLCVLGCVALVYTTVGSLELDQVNTWASAHPELPPSMQLAAVLVVVAVALKSAQLPFHGWLIQVMEAPTPVSALLHAGIVNIGGFVLIRLSPWIAHAQFALLLLVLIGLVSAIVAALVMTTRVSVKVALAWSTCAQMGFMLVQCGLGLWHLALLHLVAHSLYKAHAFLSAGTTVDDWRLQAATQRPLTPSWAGVSRAALVAVGGATFATVVLLQFTAASLAHEPSTAVLALIVGLSLIPLLSRRTAGVFSIGAVAARTSGVVLLYITGHWAAAQLLPAAAQTSNAVGWALVAVGFVGLFAVKATLQILPEGRLARALYPWLFAGLYLDERFTRLTFRVWPPTHPQTPRTFRIPQTLEA